MTARPARKRAHIGQGVDVYGGPVIDPTANVIALSLAANQRQDDLRELTNRLMDSELRRLEEKAILRAEFAKEIQALESNRLNAIRQVDVLAVSTAADRAQAAIQTLAAQTTANAENLRNALTVTANTIASQTAATVGAITERLSALEKSSYEGKGKQAIADPQLAELVSEMKSLRVSRDTGVGKSEGISASWAFVVAVGTLILGLLGALGYSSAKSSNAPPFISPQIIYVPVPSPTPVSR